MLIRTRTQLPQDMEHAVEVRQSRSETVDEFVEHELAVNQVFLVLLNLLGQILEELGLHATQCFGGHPAPLSQIGVAFFPIAKLDRLLALSRPELLLEIFQESHLAFLSGDQLLHQCDHDLIGIIVVAGVLGRIGGDVDLKNRRDRWLVGRHMWAPKSSWPPRGQSSVSVALQTFSITEAPGLSSNRFP